MAATETDHKPAVMQIAKILNCAGPEFIQVYDQFTWETEVDKNNPHKLKLSRNWRVIVRHKEMYS